MRKAPALILGATAVLALVAGVVLLGERSSAQGLDLEGVSAKDLKDHYGVVLRSPEAGDNPAVDGEDASEVVKSERPPGAKVRDITLARFEIDGDLVESGRLVWAVSLDPDSISPPAPSGWRGPIELKADGSPDYGTVVYTIVFVDAESGEFVYSVTKFDLPEYMR